ncbi:MAG: aspartate kinase, partial [Candidatus Izemoplasma sp.]
MLTVAKFGGSSTANANQFKKIKAIIDNDAKRKVIIVSALGKEKQGDSKITDLLFLLYAHLKYSVDYETVFDLIKNRFVDIKNSLNLDYDIETEFDKLKVELNSSISEDYLASRGEYFTAKLLSEYLAIPFVDATELIFFNYDGSINEVKTSNEILTQFKNNKQMIIPGFYGAFPGGSVKLFTRGGSDVTGSIIAKFLKATLYENWTDVNGIYMADPRIVKDPLRINEITYDELRELSYMGANVLHEDTIFPLQEIGIPIQILNTNFPNSGGTTILKECHDTD